MSHEKRLIDANEFMSEIHRCDEAQKNDVWLTSDIEYLLAEQPTVDAVEVVQGVWMTEPGDLHRSGYPVWCSKCYKVHFVHHPFELGSLCRCKELFEKPKYCPSCGAFMEVEE